ncbi:MAG: hypothetical protein KGM42_12045 [Hyphomicrobiales bacterium]|nr:hypothetical protein [Hyphomicrobiales bacterium]
MPGIGQSTLESACRRLFELAAADFILPPLLREATDAAPARCFVFEAGERAFKFRVALDPGAEGLPLAFSTEVEEGDDAFASLDEDDARELVRAFLLGARAPISAEHRKQSQLYDVALQLSSTYSLPCGALRDDGGAFDREAVCDRVAGLLLDHSRRFFATPEAGRALWTACAARDLFGEPALRPDEVWLRARENAPARAEIDLELRAPRLRLTSKANAAAVVAAGVALGAALLSYAAPDVRSSMTRTNAATPAAIEPPVAERPAPPPMAQLADAAPTVAPYVKLALATLPTIKPALAAENAPTSPPSGPADVAPPRRPASLAVVAPKPRRAHARTSDTKRGNPLDVLRQAANGVAGVVDRIRRNKFKISALNSPQAVRQ